MTVPLIMKPTKITCHLYRVLPGFSLSLIYGALITKTNRIARILARSKKRIITKKPRFMSLSAQIIITLSKNNNFIAYTKIRLIFLSRL